MLAAACAVGVACCFGSPIGGVLFSIEVKKCARSISPIFCDENERTFSCNETFCIILLIASFLWLRIYNALHCFETKKEGIETCLIMDMKYFYRNLCLTLENNLRPQMTLGATTPVNKCITPILGRTAKRIQNATQLLTNDQTCKLYWYVCLNTRRRKTAGESYRKL